VTALIVGTVLAVAALSFVLYPLFFAVAERSRDTTTDSRAADDSPILALREIEFDRATGKLSEADYAELKKTYSEQALRELRGADRARREALASLTEASVPLDAIEARVREYRLTHRACLTCGVRPEPDAMYCSTCGGYLERVCPRCAAEVTESGAAFCSTCGATLASTQAGALV
jgi:RNA polymerase subunit RPABC4/transcription elongation factor Spt4